MDLMRLSSQMNSSSCTSTALGGSTALGISFALLGNKDNSCFDSGPRCLSILKPRNQVAQEAAVVRVARRVERNFFKKFCD
jgi:hypothetical protein